MPALDPELFDESTAKRLLRYRQQVVAAQLALESTARSAIAALNAESIPALTLKGLATAHADYEQPSLRQTSDVDLLVPEGELGRAGEIIVQNFDDAIPCNSFVRERLRKGTTIKLGNGVELDLHQRLSEYSPGQTALLFDSSEISPTTGFRILSKVNRLLHASVHLIGASHDFRRLSSLIDMTVILDSADAPTYDELLESALDQGLEDLVGIAISTEAAFSGRVIPNIDSWPLPTFMRKKAFLTSGARLGYVRMSAVLSQPSIIEKLQYLSDWAIPRPSRLDQHNGLHGWISRAARLKNT